MVVALFGTVLRADVDLAEYRARNERMEELVRRMPGFISVKAYTADDGDRVVIARFESEEALDAWRSLPEHVEAQRLGREAYYESYWVQVYTSIRQYAYQRPTGD
ncbi:MAG TPA: antibiotic biosynthesis monooxygenase [Ktedonobacterales bacterium]|jgi:heme-degrading monooxygenase HmoA